MPEAGRAGGGAEGQNTPHSDPGYTAGYISKPTRYLTPASGVSHHVQIILHTLSFKTMALKA